MMRFVFCALAVSMILAGGAHAACEWSDRIAVEDAECLSGGWQNQTWPNKDTAWVKNECSALGTVVTKIDRKDARDWTLRLKLGLTAKMSGNAGNIRGIYCCSDLSDLCSKSDIVNAENCIARFRASEAAQGTSEGEISSVVLRGCNPGIASATAHPANESCTIDAICSWWVPEGQNAWRETVARFEVTVPYVDVRDLTLTRDGQLSMTESR